MTFDTALFFVDQWVDWHGDIFKVTRIVKEGFFGHRDGYPEWIHPEGFRVLEECRVLNNYYPSRSKPKPNRINCIEF